MWEGPSAWDQSPIVVIVTHGSGNTKTGDMDQSWVLRRDVHPYHATQTGEDASVCGDCRHRGDADHDRSCYVVTQHGPAAIWRAYQRGRYSNLATPLDSMEIVRRITGRFLRMGAYGDPAMVPFVVWASLLPFLAGWTGYTHRWQDCDPIFRQFLMASVDTEEDQGIAAAHGWRTFRVRHTGTRLQPEEIVCPASAEAGHRTTCVQCRICAGHLSERSTRSVAIFAHGYAKVNFFRSAQAALGWT